MQCGICEQHHRRITCPQCSQAAVWPLRTEILFKTAERDVASEKVEEYLDGARGAAEVRTIRAEDLKGRLASIATERASLKGLLVNSSFFCCLVFPDGRKVADMGIVQSKRTWKS